jgi:V/A-type H+/Na+-transporting ATPase subunit E
MVTMKTLEKGKDKIQKICDLIRHETIEPAKQEAHGVIESAKARAEEIIAEAERQAERLHAQARAAIEQERNVFHSSLTQAARQSVESLKQEIEHKLFNEELQRVLQAQTADPKIIASLIASIVKAVDKDGISTDLIAVVPKSVSAAEVNRLLGEGILKRLKDQSVSVGTFEGGAQVKLVDKKMTIDISDAALKELISNYVRKDFRKMFFAS